MLSFQTIAPIEDIVSYSIKGYKKFHDGKAPKRITIYRSGSSEGNHGPIISYEVPLARVAMRNFSPDTQLLYIVVSKEHTYRFFKKEVSGQEVLTFNVDYYFSLVDLPAVDLTALAQAILAH